MSARLAGVRFVLDTNVVSELMQASPDPVVQAWSDRQGAGRLAIAAPSLLELRYGVEILAAGRRRDALAERINGFLEDLFGPRIIAFGAQEATACSSLMAKKRALGESLDDHLADAMIAACALVSELAVATRNENDFRNTGVRIVNPWRKAK